MSSSNAAAVLYRIYELPWSTAAEQERKFRKTAQIALVAVVLLALIIALLPVPAPDATQVEEVPRRIARLVLEREAPPPPPPVVREEPKPPEPEPVVEQRQVREEPQPKPEPKPEPKPVEGPAARERAAVAGLLPFAQQLASLRDDNAAERLDRAQVSGAVEGAMPLAERSLITSRVGASSGGINTAALSRNTGGGGFGNRSVTQVENPVEGFQLAGGAAQRSGESDKASRSREEIERVFDQNKGAIYTLYNRALRQNPALEGKLVLRLTIAPDGRVTFCEVVSSELNDPDLEQKLVQRVLLFQFESRTSSRSRLRSRSTSSPPKSSPGSARIGGLYSRGSGLSTLLRRSTPAHLRGKTTMTTRPARRQDPSLRLAGKQPGRAAPDPGVRTLPGVPDHGRLRRSGDGLRRTAMFPEWNVPGPSSTCFRGGNSACCSALRVRHGRGQDRPPTGARLGHAVLLGAHDRDAFARNIDELLWLRFVAGIGLGCIIPNATALVGEFSPKRAASRSRCASPWASRLARRSAASSRSS